MLRKPGFWIVVVFGVLSLRLFSNIDRHAVNVLYWDHWDFYLGLFEDRSWWELFRFQHGPHRQGIGFWLIRVIDSLSGWNLRVESFAAGTLFVLSAVFALLLKKRLSGTWTWSDCLIPLIFIKTATWENLYGTVNLAHGPLPLLLVLTLALLLTCAPSINQLILILIVGFLGTFTGFGFFLGLVIPGIFILRGWTEWMHSRKVPWLEVGGVVLSAVTLAFFFYGYQNRPAADCFVFPDPRPWRYIHFMASQMQTVIGIFKPNPFLALPGYLILAFFTWVFYRLIKERNYPLLAMAMFSLLFSVNCAIGRSCLGMLVAVSSRYVPYTMPLQFAAYLFVLKQPPSELKKRGLQLAAVFLILSEFVFSPLFFRKVPRVMESRRAWVECYLSKGDIATCDAETGTQIYPVPEATRLKEKLDFLKQRQLNLFLPKS